MKQGKQRLGDLLDEVRTGPFGSTLHASDYTAGGVPVINPKHFRDGIIEPSVDSAVSIDVAERLSSFRLEVGDVVVARRGEMGRCAVVRTREAGWLLGTGSAALRPRDGLLPTYLAYFLRSPETVRALCSHSVGTTMANLNQRILKELACHVPSVREQVAVVGEIEKQFTRLDAAVSSFVCVEAKLEAARASILQAAVEGRLVPTEAEVARAEGRTYEPAAELLERVLQERRRRFDEEKRGKRYKPPVEPDQEELPLLPEGWTWASIDQLFDHRLGKMLDKAKNQGKFRPYLRNANVRWFGFELDDLKRMRVQDEELAEVSVRYGDIVVCEGGEPGRAAVWTKSGEAFVIQKACHRLRPVADMVPQFYTFVLAAEASRRLPQSFTGSTIRHLTGRKLRPFPVPLPPLDEQRRIFAEAERRLSVIDALKANVRLNLARCKRLREAILKSAFEGRLVPSDYRNDHVERVAHRTDASKEARP